MTNETKMKKLILILLPIYLVLTIDATILLFQGQLAEEAIFLLSMNYSIFLTILIYMVYNIAKIIYYKRNILRTYYSQYELLLQMKSLYEIAKIVQMKGYEINKLKECIEKLETELVKSGHELIDNKLLLNCEKRRLKEIIKEIEIRKI